MIAIRPWACAYKVPNKATPPNALPLPKAAQLKARPQSDGDHSTPRTKKVGRPIRNREPGPIRGSLRRWAWQWHTAGWLSFPPPQIPSTKLRMSALRSWKHPPDRLQCRLPVTRSPGSTASSRRPNSRAKNDAASRVARVRLVFSQSRTRPAGNSRMGLASCGPATRMWRPAAPRAECGFQA